MITCDLKGGLGNQLFQIAATLGYCVEHNIPFIFPYSNAADDRPTYWENFFDNLKQYTTSRQNFPDAEPAEVLKVLHTLPKYEEPSFSYNEIPRYENLMLCGYFQSSIYSQKIRCKFHDIFDTSFKQLAIKTEYLHLLDAAHMISIHFRMGDYKHKTDYHPILPLDYYVNCLVNVAVPSRALVFCEAEDNEVIAQHLDVLRNRFPQITFIKVSDDIPDWKQISMMSCCHTHIIANSSFSWWGAHLNGNRKTVFYPNMWFGPKIEHSLDDMFPPDWIQIRCDKIDY
jgi:hypothetical protein